MTTEKSKLWSKDESFCFGILREKNLAKNYPRPQLILLLKHSLVRFVQSIQTFEITTQEQVAPNYDFETI